MRRCRNRTCTKRDCKNIDFAKLLGFETVSKQNSKGLDFQDPTFGDKLGAKVGGTEPAAPGNGIALFQDDAVAAKFGTKRGGDIEPTESA